MNKTESAYVPGVCNINMAEVAYRRKWRNIGLITAAVLLAILLVVGASRWLRVIIFLPLVIGVVGYYQTKHRFCVGYGASGMQNAAEGSDKAKKVDAASAAKDKQFAQSINRKSMLISVAITTLALLLPEA